MISTVHRALGRVAGPLPALARRIRGSRGMRPAAAVAAALGLALPVSGCGLFGAGTEIATPSVLAVSSSAFAGNVMPARFTCGAAHVPSPPLGWSGTPAGTKSFAVVMDDSDAPITPYVYWVVFNISPVTTDILEGAASGQLPPGAREAQNSAGTATYDPPCPGSASHTYRFTVYALNKTLNLPAGTSLESAWQAIASSAIGRGRDTPTVRARA